MLGNSAHIPHDIKLPIII